MILHKKTYTTDQGKFWVWKVKILHVNEQKQKAAEPKLLYQTFPKHSFWAMLWFVLSWKSSKDNQKFQVLILSIQ